MDLKHTIKAIRKRLDAIWRPVGVAVGRAPRVGVVHRMTGSRSWRAKAARLRRVRGNPGLTFRQLVVGDLFVFMGEEVWRSMAQGPWVKNGPKTYQHVDDIGMPPSGMRYGSRIRVGSVGVAVRRV